MIIIKQINDIFNLLYNEIMFKRHNIIVGRSARINGRVKFINKGTIKIGNCVQINSGINYNVIGGDIRTNFMTFSGALISIGNNTGISNATIVSRQSIIIGNDVLIGGGCKIYDNDFHPLKHTERIIESKNEIVSKSITIGDGVFIGAHSIILKGVNIGKHSIVGAGSVITKSIPDSEVWAGNPAKFIRKLNE